LLTLVETQLYEPFQFRYLRDKFRASGMWRRVARSLCTACRATQFGIPQDPSPWLVDWSETFIKHT